MDKDPVKPHEILVPEDQKPKQIRDLSATHNIEDTIFIPMSYINEHGIHINKIDKDGRITYNNGYSRLPYSFNAKTLGFDTGLTGTLIFIPDNNTFRRIKIYTLKEERNEVRG